MCPLVDVALPALVEAAALPGVLSPGTVRGTVRAVADMSRIQAAVEAGTGSAPVTQ